MQCGCCKFTPPVYQCWSFIMTVFISVFVLTVSVCGLAGLFKPFTGDSTFFGGLIGTIVGLWFPRPTVQQTTENVTENVKSIQNIYVDGETN